MTSNPSPSQVSQILQSIREPGTRLIAKEVLRVLPSAFVVVLASAMMLRGLQRLVQGSTIIAT